MISNIASNTGIDLNNERLITNHSCRRTAIQLLKNRGISESELQSFSEQCSRQSLAEYCKISNDQYITNTVMLISFSFEDLDLDKYDYSNEYGSLIEEAYDNNESNLDDFSINKSEIQKTQPTNIETQKT
ncbi:46083_t:CDS:2 [Gigaspora margarita]|uniref:46083_t:CDS:1 n=1 Tax=Gigaspora margarita TaxID=4874 RepID=A0ABN7WCT4_GIGMA|nr:46083_t:CDS:2 [Gigaspora margarita]